MSHCFSGKSGSLGDLSTALRQFNPQLLMWNLGPSAISHKSCSKQHVRYSRRKETKDTKESKETKEARNSTPGQSKPVRSTFDIIWRLNQIDVNWCGSIVDTWNEGWHPMKLRQAKTNSPQMSARSCSIGANRLESKGTRNGRVKFLVEVSQPFAATNFRLLLEPDPPGDSQVGEWDDVGWVHCTERKAGKGGGLKFLNHGSGCARIRTVSANHQLRRVLGGVATWLHYNALHTIVRVVLCREASRQPARDGQRFPRHSMLLIDALLSEPKLQSRSSTANQNGTSRDERDLRP